MNTWPRASAAVLALGLLLSGNSALGAALPSELPAKPEAPEWQLADLADRHHQLRDYRGKWVLMHFWATWCGPCIEELPSLDRLRQDSGDGLQVLAVNVGETPEVIAATTDPLQIELLILRDHDSQVSGQWQVQGLPTTYLVDPQGRVFGGVTGTRDWSDPLIRNWLLEKIHAAEHHDD